MPKTTNTPLTVGQYLLEQLHALGVSHIFGIPGDYVLRFNKLIEMHSHIEFINTTRESTAGYAANAYGLLRGLGVACVTYGVGIEVISSMTQAHIESYPLVVISGTIADDEFRKRPESHHLINKVIREGADCTQLEIFKLLTIDQGVLNNPSTAAAIIDRVLHNCLKHKKPVYLEIPRNIVDQPLSQIPEEIFFCPSKSDPLILTEALKEAETILTHCRSPLIWAGHEIARFGLSSPLLEFAEKHQIPIVSSLLGKTVIDEHHPLFIGVYQGEMSSEKTLEALQKCDCLLIVGVILSDIDTGISTVKLDQDHRMIATGNDLKINHHHYPIFLHEFIEGLNQLTLPQQFHFSCTPRHTTVTKKFEAKPHNKTTIKRVFECIQSHLNPTHILVSDVGDALFASADLALSQNSFISNSYFASIGVGTSAAIGAQIAEPNRRVIAIVGDGGFQMSSMELSTAVRYHLDPIVIVLNNHGYGTERVLLEGNFNDLVDWNYSKIPLVLGGGVGIKAETEEEFQQALEKALAQRGTFYLIEVCLDKTDFSPALQRLGKALGKIVKS